LKKTLFTLSLTLLVASLIVFIACSKNSGSNTGPTNSNNIPPDQMVTASLQGRVVDESGLPVQGAAVSSGTVTTTTDVNGVFAFTSINMSSRFGYVKVVKQGYFTGSRSIITNPAASNYVSIQLMPRTATGTFPAAGGGKIVVQAGDTAAFTGSSVVNAATNAAYTGTVHVFATYLDPTDPNLYKYMPGDLRGIGTDGNETALQSFGMMLVELEDDAGNKLQIASGQQATLSWGIPASLQATAPATIPLWYFNDTTGRWIQQGTATRQGNSYTGEVGHFSYWNCDAPMGTVNFKVHLKDQHGNPLAYTFVQFQSQTLGTRGGYTDSSGFAQGLIPKGQSLLMQVVSPCGSLLGGVNVGPALTDQDLGTVTVTIDHAELTLTGTVVDCSNNPVDSGFVNATVDGLNYRAMVSKGNFTLPVSRCFISNVSVQLLAVDLGTSQQSNVTTITADTGTVKAGQLTACSTPGGPNTAQYMNFVLGGTSYAMAAPNDDINYNFSSFNSLSYISGSNVSSGALISINQLTATGTYSNDSAYINTPQGVFTGLVTTTITAFGPIDSYVEGSFTGPIAVYGGQTQTVTGSFRVQRTN
jgi:hypothetical protein